MATPSEMVYTMAAIYSVDDARHGPGRFLFSTRQYRVSTQSIHIALSYSAVIGGTDAD